MPRHFIVEVNQDNIRIDEMTEEGKYIDTYHNTDVTRFIAQNNVQSKSTKTKPRTKFKKLDITISDEAILETYLLVVEQHTDGTVTDIHYDTEI